MTLTVVVVAKKRMFQLLSGVGGAGVEQTAQKSEKQGWTAVGQWGGMMVEKMQLRGESQFSAPADGSSAFAAAKAEAL